MKPRSQKIPTTFVRKPWQERLSLFVIVVVFWLLLTRPVADDGSLRWTDISDGVVWSSTADASPTSPMFRQNFIRLLNPRAWFWAFIYMFVFAWEVFRGGMDVVYRVLHPNMPIHPGIVRVRSKLTSDTGQIVLANSITLTPGTLTVEVAEGGVFYVHWLNVLSTDDEEAAEFVLRRFEWFIKRIFE